MPLAPRRLDLRGALPAAAARGALRTVAAALGALREWWVAGRHYRPERRYMRGGRQGRAPGLAGR